MPFSVLVALGSNFGDRALSLRRAIDELRKVISVVRVSPFIDTEPADAPPGSPRFLNAVIAGYTDLGPRPLLDTLLRIESRLGRRRTIRNAPRIIDLDLILHSAHLVRTPALTLPHPRYLGREFVREPLRALGLAWRDPAMGIELSSTLTERFATRALRFRSSFVSLP
jgi:2-amino-4-hydroxy-6-hydroxymethyldihydropteridine diphosphokinase